MHRSLYPASNHIAEGTKISKLENIEDDLDNPPKPVVIYSDFLNHQSHGWKFMGLGPDSLPWFYTAAYSAR